MLPFFATTLAWIGVKGFQMWYSEKFASIERQLQVSVLHRVDRFQASHWINNEVAPAYGSCAVTLRQNNQDALLVSFFRDKVNKIQKKAQI